MQGNSINNGTFVNNNNEMSYMWSVYNTSVLSRIVMNESGSVQRFVWFEQERGWNEIWSAPTDRCDQYGHCGAFGLCDPYNATEFECTCLPGFEPKSPGEWFLRDASHGCTRKPGSSICWKGEGFVKLENVKIPDTSKVQVISSLSLKACEQECLRNCNCIASVDIGEGVSGRITWHENLIDTRKFTVGGQDFYIRVDEPQYGKKLKGFVATKGFRAIMVVSGVLILFGISFFGHWFVKSKGKVIIMIGAHYVFVSRTRETLLDANISEESPNKKKLGESRRQTDLPFFDIRTLITATDNFSATNKLGEGGFGSVFKGQLVNGHDIAVKRLSKHSGQGMEEFKNEVTVIAKLQHRNLVRLLGYCIHEEEKMLIYEYLPNRSVDYFIYDETRRSHLDWRKRIEIINGIARGILYLHHDSRLKIIHRDLKASNILLDAAMNPKISDFGIAKMFGEDQTKGNTKRVVGTYGYMSPEYAMHGVYSTKSDVFSFGVWELWKEGRMLDIVDPTLYHPFSAEEVSRCIHIGLLCVQEATTDRPTVSSVVFMLANETTLPPPKTPAFIFHDKCSDGVSSTSRSGGDVSLNSVTITTLAAR
ncbi:hypothetical protein FNV43_RR07705 [Rhamnella rubrinervis]|uniref:non-specific serine/threonine protein kinase n=1 Tax=Rhamnella rubrinervis TaxID=2594499 RepID=A0A8K0MN90_9ROSA|nr:hypothetical protein FNV43_RR07705 [Rhamnella rubrinervis]